MPYLQLATSAASFFKTIAESQVLQVLNIGSIRGISTKFILLYLLYAAGEVSAKLFFYISVEACFSQKKYYVLHNVLGRALVMFSCCAVLVLAHRFLYGRAKSGGPDEVHLTPVCFSVLMPVNFVARQRKETR